MDSKLRNKAILLVLSIMALIFGLVAYTNKEKLNIGSADEATTVSVQENYGDNLSEEQLHAFLNDDLFFDSDVLPSVYRREDTQVTAESDNQLFMFATSVERDIRVAITDAAGRPVTGQPFFVTLDNAQEYKDLDQDGIIYIPDISAGDYYITLNRIDGYEVPADPMRVTVKAQLEFTPIDDISYLICSEADIDPTVEDTMVDYLDTEDVDETQSSELITSSEGVLGIDVSKWQKDIDWQRVADAGITFAIIRCGYRGSQGGCLVEDPYFVQNIEGAKAAGINVGIYFFTQAVSDVEAVEEASMCLKLIEDYKLDLPIFIDSESAGGRGRADGLDKETRTNVCKAFCQTIVGAGQYAGIYASRNWFYNNLNTDELSDFYIWDAEYRSAPAYTGKYDIWQYTSSGMIDGISTRVDLDISYIINN